MRRTFAWLVVAPLAGSSVLLGHAIAYRVTGTPAGDLHGYLAHAPQVVLVLATLALLGLAMDARARRRSPVPLASLAVMAFVAQEHLERLIHTGELPFLLTSPALWVGIALQVPLTVVIWLVASRLAEEIAAPVRRTVPRLGPLTLRVIAIVRQPNARGVAARHPGRGPPVFS